MAKNNNLTDLLTSVANAIRTKKGTSELINPQNFDAEINSIQGETLGGEYNIEQVVNGDECELNITTAPQPEDLFSSLISRSMSEVTADNLKNVTSIGSYAFYQYTSLSSVTFPHNMTRIGERAFAYCTNLTEITIPANIVYMGAAVFYGTSKVNTINFNAINMSDNTSSSDTPFIQAGSRTSCVLHIGSAVKRIPSYIFGNGYDNASYISSVVFEPDSNCLDIGDSAFTYCRLLKSITMPDSLARIGASAFYGCVALKSITIPANVKSIGTRKDGTSPDSGYVFAYCGALESITVSSENTIYHSSGNCVIKTASKTLTAGCKTSVIPADGSVTTIGLEAFSYRTTLTSIEIPEGVESIGERAFYGCKSLTSIDIPDSVTSIGKYAFNGCSKLTAMTILATTPPTLQNTYAISAATTTIYIPAGTLSAYQSATNWSLFASKFVELEE